MLGLISVLIGGGIGAYLRHIISLVVKARFNVTCKNTFFINIFGCLCFGIILTLVNHFPLLLSNNVKLFFNTGIIASFTTFGTFAYENVLLLKDKEFVKAFFYTTLSLFIGTLATFLGIYLTEIMF